MFLFTEDAPVTGKTQIEKEYRFLSVVKDFSMLADMATSQETFEQWYFQTNVSQNKGKVKGVIRVRSINGTKFILTVKSNKTDNVDFETETIITEGIFNHFKILAPTGIIKTRYKVPYMGYNYEVDVFHKLDGTPTLWCVVEIEVAENEVLLDTFMDIPCLKDIIEIKTDKVRDNFKKKLQTVKIKHSDCIFPVF